MNEVWQIRNDTLNGQHVVASVINKAYIPMQVLSLANLVLSHLCAGSVYDPVANCSSLHWSASLTQEQVVAADTRAGSST
jgi:hypothetical protein